MLISEHHIPFVAGTKRIDPVMVKIYLDASSDPSVKPIVRCNIICYGPFLDHIVDTVYYDNGVALRDEYTHEQAKLILAAIENGLSVFANNLDCWLGV